MSPYTIKQAHLPPAHPAQFAGCAACPEQRIVQGEINLWEIASAAEIALRNDTHYYRQSLFSIISPGIAFENSGPNQKTLPIFREGLADR
jgi:hypothetical protein